MTRIFNVKWQYQELYLEGKNRPSKDCYSESKNVVAKDAIAAAKKAIRGFDKPRKVKNDEDKLETYKAVNIVVTDVEMLAEA